MTGSSDLDSDYIAAGFRSRLGFGERPAILVIDAVRAYLDPDSPLYLPTGEAAMRAMEQLVDCARQNAVPVIFTAVRYEQGAINAPLFFSKVPSLAVFTQGNPLGDFPTSLIPHANEPKVYKHYASAFFGTSLPSWLNTRRIDTLILGGFSTSGCIRASALDALQYGYRPIIPREAVADRDPGPHEANLFDLDAKYADVVPLTEVLSRIETARSKTEK